MKTILKSILFSSFVLASSLSTNVIASTHLHDKHSSLLTFTTSVGELSDTSGSTGVEFNFKSNVGHKIVVEGDYSRYFLDTDESSISKVYSLSASRILLDTNDLFILSAGGGYSYIPANKEHDLDKYHVSENSFYFLATVDTVINKQFSSQVYYYQHSSEILDKVFGIKIHFDFHEQVSFNVGLENSTSNSNAFAGVEFKF